MAQSDAALYRMAVKLSEHDREINDVYARLRRGSEDVKRAQREISATRREVRTVGAGSAKSAATRASAVRLSQRGVRAGGVGISGKGAFTMRPNRVIGGGGAFLLFGAPFMAASAVQRWEELEDVRERYGVGEALGRMGRGPLRSVFVEPARGLAEAFGTLLFSKGQSRNEYIRRFEDFWRQPPLWARMLIPLTNLTKETDAEYEERRDREQRAVTEAANVAHEFVQRNFIQPIEQNAMQTSAVVRTSKEAAGVRAKLWRENQSTIMKTQDDVYKAALNTMVGS